MFLWVIYIFPRLVCLLRCRKIVGTTVGMYKSLTDTWMWKFWDWGRACFFWKYINRFSLQCIRQEEKSQEENGTSEIYGDTRTEDDSHCKDTTEKGTGQDKIGEDSSWEGGQAKRRVLSSSMAASLNCLSCILSFLLQQCILYCPKKGQILAEDSIL
jgi:hypothetical protein